MQYPITVSPTKYIIHIYYDHWNLKMSVKTRAMLFGKYTLCKKGLKGPLPFKRRKENIDKRIIVYFVAKLSIHFVKQLVLKSRNVNIERVVHSRDKFIICICSKLHEWLSKFQGMLHALNIGCHCWLTDICLRKGQGKCIIQMQDENN